MTKLSGHVLEIDIQKHFFEHLSNYLPNAKAINRTDISGDDRRGIPDGWVQVNNMICPVEVKQKTFGIHNGLPQLLSYIKKYNCLFGVAVAERFSCYAKGHPRIIYITIPVERNA